MALKVRSRTRFKLGDSACDETLHLVPGGRYLFTRKNNHRTLRLWDLGLPGIKIRQPRLIAEMQPGRTVGIAVSFCMDMVRLALDAVKGDSVSCVPPCLIYLTLGSTAFYRVMVYDVDVSGDIPAAFQHRGTLEVKRTTQVYINGFYGDCLHVSHSWSQKELTGWHTMWHFRTCRYSSWRVVDEKGQPRPCLVSLHRHIYKDFGSFDDQGFKGIFKGETAIHLHPDGLFCTRVPHPRLADTTKGSPGSICTLKPDSLLSTEHSFHTNQLPFASFGLDKPMWKPYHTYDACFPRRGLILSNGRVMFDLFLRDHDNPSKGYTVNRYRLDLHITEPRTSAIPDSIECSLSVEETFTFKNDLATIYRPNRYAYMGFIDQAHPLNCAGLFEVERVQGWRSTHKTTDEAYILVPCGDADSREEALTHSGSSNLDRPTTAMARCISLYARSGGDGGEWEESRVLCERTGRAVGVRRQQETQVGSESELEVPPARHVYHVYDYVHG